MRRTESTTTSVPAPAPAPGNGSATGSSKAPALRRLTLAHTNGRIARRRPPVVEGHVPDRRGLLLHPGVPAGYRNHRGRSDLASGHSGVGDRHPVRCPTRLPLGCRGLPARGRVHSHAGALAAALDRQNRGVGATGLHLHGFHHHHHVVLRGCRRARCGEPLPAGHGLGLAVLGDHWTVAAPGSGVPGWILRSHQGGLGSGAGFLGGEPGGGRGRLLAADAAARIAGQLVVGGSERPFQPVGCRGGGCPGLSQTCSGALRF